MEMAEDEAAASGKFPVIKIKFPKKAEEEVRSHYCKECDKSFTSGKALGGHMSSAHVQANKDYSLKKVSSSSNSKRKSPGSPSTACMICGRVFQSQKSLFGHMRCHPEREWRGMEPPTRHEAKVDSAQERGLGFFNPKEWPTSKRGRAPISSNPIVWTDKELIKEGDAEIKGKTKDKELIKQDEIKGTKDKNKASEIVIDPTDDLFITAVEVLVSGKREKEEMDPKEKFKCDVCPRVFLTYQALGGHRSSHNKFKMTIVNTNTRHLEPPKMKKRKIKKIKTNSADTNVNANCVVERGDVSTANANCDVERGDASTSVGAAFAFDLNMEPPLEEDEEEDMEDSSNHTS